MGEGDGIDIEMIAVAQQPNTAFNGASAYYSIRLYKTSLHGIGRCLGTIVEL